MTSPGSRPRSPVLSAFGAARSPSQLQETAHLVEQAGFRGLWLPEGAQPVFEMCTAAALATPSLRQGTSVAVAFARSPMLTAQAAWMLSQATGGRFVLGLGTQVRAHVERRYSAAFSSPGPRMREYVQAVRAIYAGFRGAPLRFDERFYSFSLLPATWSPGPMDYPDPPIYVAGVRPWMCRMVGEVADGMLVHPLSTPAYIDSVVIPAIQEGRRIAERPADDVALVCPVMTAVSDDADIRARQRESIRARIAFYGSTPGYGVVFDASGWPGVGEQLHRMQRAGDLETMKGAITDELLDAIAVTSTWAELPEKLVKRFAGRADEIVCYSVVEQWRDETDSLERWQDVNRRFNDLVRP